MTFTTQIFIFLFFPVCMAAYYAAAGLEKAGRFGAFLVRLRARDLLLLLVSLAFYVCSCMSVEALPRLCLFILAVYLFGWLVCKCKEKPAPVVLGLVFAAVGILVFYLVYTKYWSIVLEVWNWLFAANAQNHSLTALLGISFLTFSAISYIVDIFRGTRPGSLLDCALYLSFFPKVISGPIVLWKDFETQIGKRRPSVDLAVSGIERLMIGFAKKVILADTFGACLQSMASAYDTPTAWLGALLYMLQIYYDFAGYSDMAIGLARLFGVEIKENFQFPYCSRSVSEFWRRWHISLGTWFRTYVYFPLGGSRVKLGRNLLNLFIIFVLTGLWHGNGWVYLLWGILNGILVVLERLLRDNRLYARIPAFLKWLGTMLFTLVCWEFFRFESLQKVFDWSQVALGLVQHANIPYTWRYYLDARTLTLVLVGAVGAVVFGWPRLQALYRRFAATKLGYAVQELVLLAVFVLAILFMVNSDYSPFIYFQY